MDVSDRGAAHVEGAYGSAGFGTFREVGAQGERVAGQRGNPSGVAPALPLVPHLGLDVTGRLGACCGDHCGDPLGVCLCESGRQAGRVSADRRTARAGRAAVMSVFMAGL